MEAIGDKRASWEKEIRNLVNFPGKFTRSPDPPALQQAAWQPAQANDSVVESTLLHIFPGNSGITVQLIAPPAGIQAARILPSSLGWNGLG